MPFPEVLDSSILNDLKECPQKFYLAHCMDWKPRGTNVHLHAGGAFAKGCEVTRAAFYLGEHDVWVPGADPCIDEGCENQPELHGHPGKWSKKQCQPSNRQYAIEAGLNALMASYGSYEAPDYGSGSAKTLDRMAGALIYYWDNYPLDDHNAYPIPLPGGARGIEFNFAHPLPINHPDTGNPLLYTGRLDAVLAFAGGHWGFDEKTTSSLGSTWSGKWGLRGQFIGYTWGCREAGIPIKGIVVRGISILKKEYQTQQSINEYPDWMIDQWYAEMLRYVRQAVEMYRGVEGSNFLHNYGEACASYGGCQFVKACESQNPQPHLETQFERRHWNPIDRTETLIVEPAP